MHIQHLPDEVSGNFAIDGPLKQVGNRCLARVAVYGKRECFHVLPDGTPAYQTRYNWVGDFVSVGPDGFLAEVCLLDAAFHIRPDGQPAYQKRYHFVSDFCDVGDKFLAIARDDSGVFHIKTNGTPAYDARFSSIESFIDTGVRFIARAQIGAEILYITPDGNRA